MSSTTANHYTDPVLVKAEVEIQSEHTAAFIAALQEFIAVVLATEPCGSFEVFRDLESGTKFLLVEKWRSRAYYLGPHQDAPHLGALFATVTPWLAGAPQFTFWDAA